MAKVSPQILKTGGSVLGKQVKGLALWHYVVTRARYQILLHTPLELDPIAKTDKSASTNSRTR